MWAPDVGSVPRALKCMYSTKKTAIHVIGSISRLQFNECSFTYSIPRAPRSHHTTCRVVEHGELVLDDTRANQGITPEFAVGITNYVSVNLECLRKRGAMPNPVSQHPDWAGPRQVVTLPGKVQYIGWRAEAPCLASLVACTCGPERRFYARSTNESNGLISKTHDQHLIRVTLCTPRVSACIKYELVSTMRGWERRGGEGGGAVV